LVRGFWLGLLDISRGGDIMLRRWGFEWVLRGKQKEERRIISRGE
jgi:hypothetical protein